MRRIVALLILLPALFSWTGPVRASVAVTDLQVAYEFGQAINFTARLDSDQPVEKVTLFFQAENDTHTTLGEAAINPQQDQTYSLEYVHQISDYPLRAFAWIDYRWDVTLQDGTRVQGLPNRFYYRDNRFAWNSLQEQPFTVYWYEGELEFAQAVLDAAQQGMIQMQNLIPMPLPTTLDIYVYGDSQTMMPALRQGSADWVAGHADPDLGVVIVALPPGPERNLLAQQRVPHELMHILLYQTTNLGYRNLPTWLNEGLASLAEVYPNSDYEILLQSASKNETLLPLNSLCRTFPRDASGALLSYAESASFVRYLHSAFGTSGLEALLTQYANGLDCERGAQRALGKGLAQLERQWRRDVLAEDTAATTANNLLPWVVLLSAALAAPTIVIALRLRQARATP